MSTTLGFQIGSKLTLRYAVVCALMLTTLSGCTSPSTPSTTAAEPRVSPACEQWATEACYSEDPEPLSPPVVVGPGRIRVLTRSAFGQRRSPSIRSKDWRNPEQRFVLVDFTFEGMEVLIEGHCPERSRPLGFALVGPGLGAILCASPGEFIAYIGFAHRKDAPVEWRIREEIWPESAQHTATGGAEPSPYFAELNGKIVVLIKPISTKGSTKPPWGVHIVPSPPGYVDLCGDWCPETVVALIVARGALHIVMTDSDSDFYSEFILTADGKMSFSDPLKSAVLSAGALEGACVSQGKDGSATLVLPVKPSTDEPGVERVATLRLAHATLPFGPDVYPTDRAFCAPTGFTDSTGHLSRSSVRATLGEQSLLVYTVDSVYTPLPDGTEKEIRPSSFRVYRRTKPDK